LPLVVVVCLTGVWITSHHRAVTCGVELPEGVIGIVLERGSVLFATGSGSYGEVLPFYDILEYEGSLGPKPDIEDSIRGILLIGSYPDYPGVNGLSIPLWIVMIVSLTGLAVVQIRKKRKVEALAPQSEGRDHIETASG